jgi:hypothetical protein
VLERDGGRCRYCRLAQLGHGATFHIDHLVPRSKGGPTTLANLALQFPNCSLHKSDKLRGADPQTGQAVPLFHPLEQAWEDHFNTLPGGECRGLTAIARATIDALGMNETIPRLARACQLALGIMSVSGS